MTSLQAVEAVASELKKAKFLRDIFGAATGASKKERERAVKKQFSILARMVHPDHVPANASKDAGDAFMLLLKARDAALDAIEKDTYDTLSWNVPSSSAPYSLAFTSPRATYRASSAVLYEGDYSVYYRGKRSGDDAEVLLKIARDPTANPMLAQESVLHGRLATMSGVARFVPDQVDSFLAEGERGTRYRVNVLREVGGLVSLETLLAKYPHGLEPVDAAWIGRRVFAQAVLATMVGVIHTAILPPHILVHPVTREPLHMGWAHAIDAGSGARMTHILERYRSWYPREVFESHEVSVSTDIAMAASCVMALFSGSPDARALSSRLPHELSQFLRSCGEPTSSRRPNDPRMVLDRYTALIRKTWGRTYRPLIVPV